VAVAHIFQTISEGVKQSLSILRPVFAVQFVFRYVEPNQPIAQGKANIYSLGGLLEKRLINVLD
jgi:hypothetical protein